MVNMELIIFTIREMIFFHIIVTSMWESIWFSSLLILPAKFHCCHDPCHKPPQRTRSVGPEIKTATTLISTKNLEIRFFHVCVNVYNTYLYIVYHSILHVCVYIYIIIESIIRHVYIFQIIDLLLFTDLAT